MSDQGPGPSEYAFQRTYANFQEDRSLESLERTLRELGELAGPLGEGPCSNWANGRLVQVLTSELLLIQRVVDGLEAVERERLRFRAEKYRTDSEPFRDGRLGEFRAECPFLSDAACLLGSRRPLQCRPDGKLAAEFAFGHAVALFLLGLDHLLVELGAVVLPLLNHPDWAAELLPGTGTQPGVVCGGVVEE